MGEISKHPDANVLDGILTAAAAGNLPDIVRLIRQSDDKGFVATALPIVNSYIHELRHALDIIFTPAGAYRIRTAMELCDAVSISLGKHHLTKIPIPLTSASDEVNREVMGLDGFEKTIGFHFTQIANNRLAVVRHDNEVRELKKGRNIRYGGDALFEALAFQTQVDLLQVGFPDKRTKKLLPLFFQEITEWDSVSLQYGWHHMLVQLLGGTPGACTLVCCIIFAALCGSMNENANYQPISEAPFVPNFGNTGRFVSEKLPRNRLDKLVKFFVEQSSVTGDDWEETWSIVDKACAQLFGRRASIEISEDIDRDEKLLSKLNSGGEVPYLVRNVFADIVAARKRLMKSFMSNPKAFLSGVSFVFEIPNIFKPVTVAYYPHGSRPDEWPENKLDWVCYETINTLGEEEEEEEDRIIYSFLMEESTGGDNAVMLIANRDSWLTMLGVHAPLYKALLYGNRYRSMFEAETSNAQKIWEKHGSEFIWDDFYKYANDITNPSSYFEFFNLKHHDCDVCGKKTDVDSGRLVSALTMRQNNKFVNDYVNKNHGFTVYELLVKDWSSWLLCNNCLQRWSFIPEKRIQVRSKGLLKRLFGFLNS